MGKMGFPGLDEVEELGDEFVHPHRLLHRNFVKVFSEFHIFIFVRQKLDEGADRRQGILDLMSKPGG